MIDELERIAAGDAARLEGGVVQTVVNTPITEATFRTYLDQVDIQIRDI